MDAYRVIRHPGVFIIIIIYNVATLVLSFYICNINLFCRDYNNKNIILVEVFINNYVPLKNMSRNTTIVVQ